MSEPHQNEVRHGSAVVLDGSGVLILGPSGSGKSTLALHLMSQGAALVADDRVLVEQNGTALTLRAPDNLPQAIEVRGVGLLNAELAPQAHLILVVDLGKTEDARLPFPRECTILGQQVPSLHKPDSPVFHLAIAHYLRLGRAPL